MSWIRYLYSFFKIIFTYLKFMYAGGNQVFQYLKSDKLVHLDLCIDFTNIKNEDIVLNSCKNKSKNQIWKYDESVNI
jgi:hypothetical protein